GSFAAPADSAIWNAVTSPPKLSNRPSGSVLESRCGLLSQVLKAEQLLNDRSRSAIATAEWPVLWWPTRASCPAPTRVQLWRSRQRTAWLLPPGRWPCSEDI